MDSRLAALTPPRPPRIQLGSFRDFFENAGVPMRRVGPEGEILDANGAELKLLGWERAEYVGRPLADFFSDPKEAAEIHGLLERGETVTGREVRMRRKDGGEVLLLLDAKPCHGGGRMLFHRDVSVEIGKRKELEEALRRELVERTEELERSHEQLRLAERLASIGTLAAGLGHDMSNILFPTLCRLDSLETATSAPQAREDLRAVREAINYLRQLSNGLRLFALDPDDPEASRGSTNLWRWWAEVSPLVGKALPRHVRLRCDIPGGLPDVAVAPHRLTQAILNLVVNAGEAIPDAGVVRVFAEPFEDRRFVRIGVEDDGVGMPPEVRRHALDPFFTTKKRGLGTGLGLSLVHAVVRSSGGTLDIHTTPGRGTSIVLSLPTAHSVVEEEPAGPVACISLEDRQMAAYASVLLTSAGFAIRSGDPAGSDLWVTEAGAIESVRRFLEGHPKRRAILVGAADDAAAEEKRLSIVAGSSGPAGMRRSLRRLVLELTEESRNATP